MVNDLRRKNKARVPAEKLSMKVVLQPVKGTAKEMYNRARIEIERALGFRGTVTSVKAQGKKIVVEFEVNPVWDLPMSEKVESLKQWIPAKVRTIFKVQEVVLRGNQRRKV